MATTYPGGYIRGKKRVSGGKYGRWAEKASSRRKSVKKIAGVK